MDINKFILDNEITQIYISKSLYNFPCNHNITSTNCNTLFYGIYYLEDIEFVKKQKGKKWILWDLNDCNPNYSTRTKNVNTILKLNITNHLSFRDKTNRYLNIFKINYIQINQNGLYNSIVYKLKNLIQNNSEIFPKTIESSNNTNLIIKYSGDKLSELVICIITCKKYLKKQMAIRETWLREVKQRNIKYFFVIGHNEKSKINDDILYVNSGDYYEDLPMKMYSLIKYIYNETDYKFIWKVDDDCYLNIKNIKNINFEKHNYYGRLIEKTSDKNKFNRKWHFNKCNSQILNRTPSTKGYICDWYGGGFGYFINRTSMNIIVKNLHLFSNELYEDKCIGEILHKNNINASMTNYLAIDYYNFKKGINKYKNKFFLVYDLSPNLILSLHKSLP